MDWYYVFLKLSEQHTSAYFPPSHNAIMWKYSTLKVTNHISLYRHELQCVSIEQNRDVLTSSGCTAHTHSRVLALMALTQFFLDPTFCLCCLLWLLVKKSEKISRIFECAEMFHYALEQQLIAVTSVPPCQKGRSLMLPKFLQQLKHLPSLPICQLFKTFPTIREDERRETWLLAFPLQDLFFFFFFVFSRIIWKYSSTNDRKFEFGFLHIVKVREGALFL